MAEKLSQELCFSYLKRSLKRYMHLILAVQELEKSGPLPLRSAFHLYTESILAERVTDVYGLLASRRWRALRQSIAYIKNISQILTQVIEIQLSPFSLPFESPIEDQSFSEEAQKAQQLLAHALTSSLRAFHKTACELKLFPSEGMKDEEARQVAFDEDDYKVFSYSHVRPNVRKDQPYISESKEGRALITSFCTRVLSAFSKLAWLYPYKDLTPEQLLSYVPDQLSEMALTSLAGRFHSLATLYDDRIAPTRLPERVPQVANIREQLEFLFSLVNASALTLHYYERHVKLYPQMTAEFTGLTEIDVHALLCPFLIYYTVKIAKNCTALAQRLLSQYSEEGEVRVEIPRYRGFHVRPSTLLAQIVAHYGTPVEMQLEGKNYNAAAPLDLFRANELVNAKKRRFLLGLIVTRFHRGALLLPIEDLDEDEVKNEIQKVFLQLLEDKKIVIYESLFPFDGINLRGPSGTTLLDLIKRAATTYLSMNKIDIALQLTARFTGDHQTLQDIALLARSGYGEDRMGNNIPLPRQLSYLSRSYARAAI